MAKTYSTTMNRHDEDETDCAVEYSFLAGSGDTYDASRGGPGGWDPGYPAEVEILKAWTKGSPPFEPTDAEVAAWTQYLMENLPERDFGPEA